MCSALSFFRVLLLFLSLTLLGIAVSLCALLFHSSELCPCFSLSNITGYCCFSVVEQSFGAMEVGSLSSAVVALEKMMVCCAMEAVVVETLVAAGRSLASILMMV